MNHKKEFDAVVAGHLCVDVFPRIPETGNANISDVLVPGTLINIGPAEFGSGGAVSNTGIAMQKMGMNVSFMSKTGDDTFGKKTIELMGRHGDVSGIKISAGENSSYTIVMAFPGFDRMFLHYTGCNDTFSSGDVDYSIVENARLFHFGYPPLMKNMYKNEGEQLIEIFKTVYEKGVVTSLDMSLPDAKSESGKVNWKKVLEGVLPYVDIFTPSMDEACFFLSPDEPVNKSPENFGRVAENFIEMGAKIIFLKAGEKGIYFRSGSRDRLKELSTLTEKTLDNWSEREIWAPSYKIDKIISATGAGDTSIAGFLAAHLRGEKIEDSLKIANCLGYQNLHSMDALSGIRDWETTLQMIPELTAR